MGKPYAPVTSITIPGARFEVMEEEAHQPFQEVPDRWNARTASDQALSGGVGNRGVVRRSGSRVCRSRAGAISR
jgi:hypothetical protein